MFTNQPNGGCARIHIHMHACLRHRQASDFWIPHDPQHGILGFSQSGATLDMQCFMVEGYADRLIDPLDWMNGKFHTTILNYGSE